MARRERRGCSVVYGVKRILVYLLVRDSKAELVDVGSLSGLEGLGLHGARHEICGPAPLSFLGYDENVCELKLKAIGEELE